MKKLFFIVVIFCSAFAAKAQCNQFYAIEDGSEWEYQSLNAKGKSTGKSIQKVSSFSKKGNGYEAIVRSQMLDDKGKEIMAMDMELKCEGGTMFIDMRNLVSQDQMKAFGNYEVKVEATNLELPSSLSDGQSLNDGNIVITALNAPIPMKMEITVRNRKVIGKESVTTPAGTFDSYKISSEMVMQSQFGLKMTVEASSVEWIAPKVAVVKTESYNKNGKLMGSTVLSRRVN